MSLTFNPSCMTEVGSTSAEDLLVGRHEEGDGEGLVLVGEGNHHELTPRPDVKVVRRHREVLKA